MKKLTLLCAGVMYACILAAQPSFQTSLEAGISLPLNSNNVNATHAGKAIHFGNHLDYSFGNGAVRFGLGAYIGYINSISTDDKYKEIGESIAEKYRFATTRLTFNSSPFKSTHILIGPVASVGSAKCSINIWAKGGYGLNEPSRYAVLYKENGVANNVYVNQGGENKNGLAYSAGAGIKYALSAYVGLQLSAGYFSTQTDQVNYNFDREKGTTPLYYTASNQFIQASAGLQFTIGNPDRKSKPVDNGYRSDVGDTDNPVASPLKIKTKSNIKNDRLVNNNSNNGNDNPDVNAPGQAVLKIKTKSNIKNDRLAGNAGNNSDDNPDNDSLFFSPEKIELRTQVPGAGSAQLQAVDNYLTGFVYQTQNGNVISQCGSNAMPGDPVPGIDVKLKRIGAGGNDLTTKTNRDGSFAFNNIVPGNYNAVAGNTAMDVTVIGDKENDFKILDISSGSCSNTKENYIINAGDKTYVEVTSARDAASGMATGKKHIGNVKYEDINAIAPRDAATGMATGKRMHKPYRVSDTDFDVNMNNIVSCDGKLYAEVIASREVGSGMATGRSTLVTGDVDGDGVTDYSSNIATAKKHIGNVKYNDFKRMHKPFVITKELDIADDGDEIVSPRDAASGLATGKRMHKPFVITKELDIADDGDEIVSPRDAASGLATGKRMHKPYVITKELDITDDGDEIVSPRDPASGLATGKRMHKPYTITKELDITDDADEIVSPRDPASGLPTGKRMHKPVSIRKELGVTDDGEEVIVYTIIHRDLSARNTLSDDDGQEKMAITEQGVPRNKGHKKGIITGKDNDTGMYTGTDDGVSEDAVKSPLYTSEGGQGVNPLFESKSNLRVIGSNGKGHDIFIPSNIIVSQASQSPIVQNVSYNVYPVKWMAPESIAARKGISEKGIKKFTPEQSENNAERKGWLGSSKNINTSEAGVGTGHIGKIDSAGNIARKGWDGTVKGGAIVKDMSRVHCADGTCTIDAIVEVEGKAYEAVITGSMKTRQGIR